MYLPLEQARDELQRRQNNLELVAKVNEFLGDCPVPTGLNGFLARHIASARLEDIQFEDRCRGGGLKPIFLEYPEDVFVSNNPSKTRLLILRILDGYGKNGGPRVIRIDLAERNLGRLNGLPLSRILTKWGEPLVQFHHRIREMVELSEEIVDLSPWLKSIGPAKRYYKFLLAICVTRGVLFESFESPGFPDLDLFTRTVVLPAYEWVRKEFSYPLIVRHPEVCSAEEEKWVLNSYPKAVLRSIPKEIR